MVKKYTYKGIVWVNLESPTQKDIEEVAREYRIHDIVAEELAAPSIRSKVDSHDDYVYFIFHFPVREASPGDADRSEIDFVVGKHFIITTHYAPFPPLEELGEILETRGPLIGKNKILNAGHLFFFIARHLYETLFSPLEAMTLELEDIERGIFEGQERAMVIRLSTASQRLIDFKKAIRSHRELLRSLEETGPLLFGSDFGFYCPPPVRNTLFSP
jgi:magnesium transporter